MNVNRSIIRKDKSTMKRKDYLIDHLFYTMVLSSIYFFWLPSIVPLAKNLQSVGRLIFCVLFAGVLGIVVSYHNNRTGKSILWDIVSGVGGYTILTLGVLLPGLTKSLIIIVASVTTVNLVMIWLCKIERSRYYIKSKFKYKAKKSLKAIRRNIGVAAVIGLLFLPITLHLVGTVKLIERYYEIQEEEGGQLAVVKAYGDEYKLSNNIDTIKRIRDNETFQKLSYDEKCEVIEDVILCEARYLGLCKINIVFDETLNDITMGRYNHSTRTIHINNNIVKNGNIPGGTAEEILHTCIHECRHCYQHLVIEMYKDVTPEQRNLFAFENEGVKMWAENAENYNSFLDGECDYYEYQYQPLEKDAKRYAAKEVLVYYEEIDKLLGEKKEEACG